MRAAARAGGVLPFGPPAPLDLPPSPLLQPHQLPSASSAERWPWLQRLRRQPTVDVGPWLDALEAGSLQPERDLLSVLVERLDGPGTLRLLRWWLADPLRHRQLSDLVAQRRDPRAAALLRERLAEQLQGPSDGPPDTAALLLPLLGHQRDPADFPLLARLALEPAPLVCRRAALEGLARGLSAWPLAPLRRALRRLASDLDPRLATEALDLLSRLPVARPHLLALGRGPLDPAVAARLDRRLRGLPASPLLLLVHGRAGGEIPAELGELAAELERRRRAPVRLQALTAERPPDPAELRQPQAIGSALPLSLVPLFLLPGGHVRSDVPAVAAHWRRSGPVRRLPFLGAWPSWQRALAAELAALPPGGGIPLLLHHPLEGGLARRYLHHLAAVTGADCRAASYSATDLEELKLAIQGPAMPLALAANRLTDSLPERLGPPLLQRPHCRRLLLEALEALA